MFNSVTIKSLVNMISELRFNTFNSPRFYCKFAINQFDLTNQMDNYKNYKYLFKQSYTNVCGMIYIIGW